MSTKDVTSADKDVLYDDEWFADRDKEFEAQRKEWITLTVLYTIGISLLSAIALWSLLAGASTGLFFLFLFFMLLLILLLAKMVSTTIPLATRRVCRVKVQEEGVWLPNYSYWDMRKGNFIPFKEIDRIELNEAPYKRYIEFYTFDGKRRIVYKDHIANMAAFIEVLSGRTKLSHGKFRRT